MQLLNQTEAAEYLDIPLRTFQRHCAKKAPQVWLPGATVPRYDPEDLDQWLESLKTHSPSTKGQAARSGASGSRTRAAVTLSPQEQLIKAKLERKLAKSTSKRSTEKKAA